MTALAQGPTGSPAVGPIRPFASARTFAGAVPTGGVTISPPSRAVRAAGAGTIVATFADGSTATIALTANETFHAEIVGIADTSSATDLTVLW